MKNIEAYYKGSGDFVDAYEKADVDKLRKIFRVAENLWFESFVAQGSKDEGSCTGGKGLQIWYRAKRRRSAELVTFVHCQFVQGNLSAKRSSKKAIQFLTDNNVDVKYYDGWMD